jgi:23S rRNA (adenine2503-C2)-methyltransferase
MRQRAVKATKNLAGLAEDAILALLPEGMPRFRAKQLRAAALQGGGRVDDVTTLPLDLRSRLASQGYFFDWGSLVEVHRSAVDGTVKMLVGLAGEASPGDTLKSVETVIIPSVVSEEAAPGTVCVSSQVGCSFACRFCRTGTQTMGGNLRGGQIAGQVLLASAALKQLAGTSPPVPSRVRSVVFMGQGEPLMNWEGVADAIRILDQDMGISPRRVTVSTVGVSPRIPLVADVGARLALSLHSARDEVRTSLMPSNARFPLSTVSDACVEYLARARGAHASSEGRGRSFHRHWSRISLEVTLLKGVNDTVGVDSDALAKFVDKLGFDNVHVNLIPFNPWPGSALLASSKEQLFRFRHELERLGAVTTIRATRGRDILAACGQLQSLR